MTNLEFKNEADFLANSHRTKDEMFDKMCEAILSNYNKLAKAKLSIVKSAYSVRPKEEAPILRLFDKLRHMAFNLHSPQSITGFLKRIATQPVKVIAKPGFYYSGGSYDREEVYGKGHFRWDWKAYTLDENELQAIRMYLGLHVKVAEPTKTPRLKQTDLPKPDFNTITDYNEQAEAFLLWANTLFTTEFKEHSIYFDGDKESRDIYTCVLRNKTHKYRFTFGQSISSTGEAPNAYDVLSCLTKYDIGSFDDFCGEFGYDADSRTAYKQYKEVLKEWKNVERLFTNEQIELLQEIQ